MSRRADQGGTAAVELALVLPLLLVIVAGIVDFGLALMIKAQIEEGAEEAAVHAARYPGDFAPAEGKAIDAVSFVTLEPADISICVAGSGIDRRITVAIEHDYDTLIDLIVNELHIGAEVKSDVLSDDAAGACV